MYKPSIGFVTSGLSHTGLNRKRPGRGRTFRKIERSGTVTTLDVVCAKMSNSCKESVAKYNRQNSNNVQVEMERGLASPTTPASPMLVKRQASLKDPRCLFRQISQNTSLVMKCVVIVSLIFNLLTIPALAAVITLMFNQANTCPTSTPLGAPDLMCYPCGDRGIPGVPAAQKTNNGYCCASKQDGDLKQLIKHNIIPVASPVVQPNPCPHGEVADRNKPPKKFSLKTVAHLLVVVHATKTAKQLKWSSEASEGRAFLQGHLEIRNDTIRVKKGGTFRIQSHFSFDSVSNKLENKSVQLFDHTIYKKTNSADNKIIVLKMEKTMLQEQNYVSSDVDLNVKLREGEEIGVSLQTFRYLYELDIANTLDIEKID